MMIIMKIRLWLFLWSGQFSVEFEDLWKFHAPVNTVEGFDVSLFDKLIEVVNGLKQFFASLKKQKVVSARREIRFAGSPFVNGRVTLLTGPTLALSAGSTNVYKGMFRPKSNPCRFYRPFFTKKVPLLFTSYRQSVPLSYTLFRTLHPL